MFDLFRSREKSTRILLGVLLGFVALSMVITLIPGFGSGGTGPTEDAVADVCGEKVTMREVQMSLQDTLRGRSIPNEMISIFAPQIVNQILNERAVGCYAREVGFSVNDEDVVNVIKYQIPSLFEGGKFAGKEAYNQFLQSNNTNVAEFERRARMLAGLRRIQNMVLEAMVATPAEVEAEYRSRNEKVSIEYAKFDPVAVRNEVKVTPEEIAAHWATSKAAYKIPEKRTFRLVVADETKMSESIKMSDEQLRRFYDGNKDAFRTAERVRARHILIKTMEKPKEDHDKLKKKTDDLLKQIRGGADFAELAKNNSEDATSAVKGGDLDFFQKGQMVPEFEKVAFGQKVNEVSEVVTSSFGYHIIQTTAKEDARLKPFEEVKDQIQKDQTRQQVYDQMTTAGDKARAALLKDPAGAEQVANQIGLLFIKVDSAKRGDPYPVVGAAVEIDDAIFDLKKVSDVSEVIQIKDNRLVVAVLDAITPERPAEMNEVESQIRDAIQNERGQRLLQERSSALIEKVKSTGGDLRKAAAALKVEVKTTNEFGRDGNADGVGPASNLEEAFRRDVGAVFGPINIAGANYICKVAGKVAADMKDFEAQKFDLLLKLKSKKAQERKDLWEDGLVQHLKRQGKVKINQDAMKRLIDTVKNS